jgi:L-threonylcarbamoyladenylate synthase
MLRLHVTASAPDPETIGRAAAAILAGSIAAIPTDTLYGLAANPFDADAVAKLFRVKSRGSEKALPLVAADLAQVLRTIGALPDVGVRLAARFWPGPLTLILRAPGALAAEVTGGTGTVGVRVPAHEVTRALCTACGVPLTATSANLSGLPATADPDVVERDLGPQLDLLLDAGTTPGGPPSTIVDVTAAGLRLVRAGAIAWDVVLAAAAPQAGTIRE